MSFSYGFFNAQNLDRVYTAEDFTAYLSSLICNGILDTYRQCFAPTVKNLSVTFGTGKAWINGHYLISDTLHTVDCASYVDESLDRYVVIALFCDLSTRTCGLRIRPGIAATEPVIPSFTNNNVTTYLTLAAVRLRAGATELTAEDVIDYREDESKCGYCKCILGKCRVTEMLAEMAKTNATLDELQKRLDAMNSQISELQTKVDDLTAGEILATGQCGETSTMFSMTTANCCCVARVQPTIIPLMILCSIKMARSKKLYSAMALLVWVTACSIIVPMQKRYLFQLR